MAMALPLPPLVQSSCRFGSCAAGVPVVGRRALALAFTPKLVSLNANVNGPVPSYARCPLSLRVDAADVLGQKGVSGFFSSFSSDRKWSELRCKALMSVS
eukprot:TRINITY_DN5132_c0_g1_i1.p2 TRINITY_DN5132_c0_g1~~TRINITY_DN5132_c0_g1_i1.p2  ORF type:complete len:109 (+),score=10.14 TRINITY_DN5132_c0_g1_i1:30-329(+)